MKICLILFISFYFFSFVHCDWQIVSTFEANCANSKNPLIQIVTKVKITFQNLKQKMKRPQKHPSFSTHSFIFVVGKIIEQFLC